MSKHSVMCSGCEQLPAKHKDLCGMCEMDRLRAALAKAEAERDDLRKSFDRTIDREDAQRARADKAEAERDEAHRLIVAWVDASKGLGSHAEVALYDYGCHLIAKGKL